MSSYAPTVTPNQKRALSFRTQLVRRPGLGLSPDWSRGYGIDGLASRGWSLSRECQRVLKESRRHLPWETTLSSARRIRLRRPINYVSRVPWSPLIRWNTWRGQPIVLAYLERRSVYDERHQTHL